MAMEVKIHKKLGEYELDVHWKSTKKRIGIVGASGSGKSLTLKSIAGIEHPDQGHIQIGDHVLYDSDSRICLKPQKRNVGYMFQNYALFPNMTVEENILTGLKAGKRYGEAQQKKRVSEMMERYQTFQKYGVRDMKGYNKKVESIQDLPGEDKPKKMPQIVIIVDELADLMMVAGKEVEDYICRIAQKARAAGIHLIVATQRPSVDVITGLIKANIPSRIAFAVSSQIDSRTILDSGGAEKLLGNGDMLFLPVGASKPVRVQGTFVTDEEIGAVLSFIKSTSTAQYDEEMIAEMERRAVAEKGSKRGGDDDGEAGGALDAMFEQAVECVIEAGQASTSLLQRRCKLGYARAARIMDQMEQEKIIGPYEGAKPRAVLVTKAQWEERKLNGQYDE